VAEYDDDETMASMPMPVHMPPPPPPPPRFLWIMSRRVPLLLLLE
jgi:hypothetical protein